MRSDKLTGFTIVELWVVLSVVGILAGLTIVGYSNVQKKARTSSSIVSASHAKKKVETYSVETGAFPVQLSTSGLPSSTKTPNTHLRKHLLIQMAADKNFVSSEI